MKVNHSIVLGVFGGMLCAVGSAHAEVTLTNLGVLGTVGSNYSSAVSTNSDGSVIVGSSSTTNGNVVFRWTPSTGMQPLILTPMSAYDKCGRVSSDGTTVAFSTANTPYRGFQWSVTEGVAFMPSLPPIFGGSFEGTEAVDVSAGGAVIVGNQVGGNAARPVRWMSTGVEDIGGTVGIWSWAAAISDNGSVILGNRMIPQSSGPPYVSQHLRAATLGNGDPQLLPILTEASLPSLASDLSADGATICGSCTRPSGGTAAVRWWKWGCCVVAEDLGVIQGWPSAPTGTIYYGATGISGDGRIIVGHASCKCAAGYEYRSFVWTAALGMTDLNSLLSTFGIDMTNTELIIAHAISADGTTIVGSGRFAGQYRAFAIHGLHLVPDPCLGDISGNGGVDGVDLTVLLGQWGTDGTGGEFFGDVNYDGVVNGADLTFVLGGWGPCPN